jgi:DNA adenine methylase
MNEEASIKNKNFQKVKPPFGYFGSKKNLSARIINHLPPHESWVELFAGSASITFAKKQSLHETINDIDPDLTNVFTQIKNNSVELCRLISLTPYASEELQLSRITNINDSELERARKFLVQSMMAVNGVFGQGKGGFSYTNSFSRQGREGRVNRWYNLPERLANAAERLKNVKVENSDALEIFDPVCSQTDTLVYVDPPYLGDRTNGYNIDANDHKFHERLVQQMLSARCMVFVSSYSNDLYETNLTTKRGWRKKEIPTTTVDHRGVRHSRNEIIWMNKQFTSNLAIND